MHEPEGWGITEQGAWTTGAAVDAPYGTMRTGAPGSKMWFDFVGTVLRVHTGCPEGSACKGSLRVTIDSSDVVTATAGSEVTWTAPELTGQRHTAKIEVVDGEAALAALTVRNEPPSWLRWAAAAAAAASSSIWSCGEWSA